MIGIYKITSPSGKIYIGQSINIEKRWFEYKGLSCKNQTALYRSLKKYGPKNHKYEIVLQCEEVELNEKERFFQDLYDVCSKNGLNCMLTKASDRSGRMSEESRKRMSESQKNRNPISDETRRKLCIARKGRIMSKESIEKSAVSRRGRKMSKESIDKMKQSALRNSDKTSARVKGTKHSIETKQKIRENRLKQTCPRTGKLHSKKSKQKCSENSTKSKLVINIETGIFYSSLREAAKTYCLNENTTYTRINGYCKNRSSLIYA